MKFYSALITMMLILGTSVPSWAAHVVHANKLHVGSVAKGKASWYGKSHQGNPTASGEKFDYHKFTAAHRTLPMGSVVKVTSLSNGRSVKVRINDRGPFKKGRILDLSQSAAEKLGMIRKGTVRIKMEVVSMPGMKEQASR